MDVFYNYELYYYILIGLDYEYVLFCFGEWFRI